MSTQQLTIDASVPAGETRPKPRRRPMTSLQLSPEDRALLTVLVERHGSVRAVLTAGLHRQAAAEGIDMSQLRQEARTP